MADFSTIIIGFFLIVIVIAIYLSKNQKSKRLEEANQLLRQKKYAEAANLLFSNGDWNKLAEIIIESPPETQVILYHRLQNHIDPNRIKSLFLALGDNYIRGKERIKGATAYNYAGLPWKAAQIYILTGLDQDGVNNAINVIDDNPLLIRDREKAIRNLAKFAFENQKIVEAAELLRIIGAEEEASAILVASGKTIDTLPSRRRPEQGLSSVNQQLHLIIAKMKQGKFQESEDMVQKLTPVINTLKKESSPEVETILRDYARIQSSLKNLRRAREAYKSNPSQAQIAYSELLDYAADYFPAEVFAEAGLAYENTSPELSREYYLAAAERGVTSQAQTSYRNRAQSLLSKIPAKVAKGITPQQVSSTSMKSIQKAEVSTTQIDRCSICKRQIKAGEEIAKCGSCESIGHYGHLAEWVKIKGTCPVCRKKLALPEREFK